MNDPHVVALIYRVDHGNSIDYSKAAPLNHDEPGFRLTVEDNRARLDFKEHYATVEQARESLAEYIRLWEFRAQLEHGPNSFRLEFDKPEVIDRNPTQGEVSISAHFRAGKATGSAKLTIVASDYPQPPAKMALNPDVETMHHRYMGYRQGREPLPALAYFCLTVLEQAAGERKKAADTYQIQRKVLDNIGKFTSTRSGPDARKYKRVATELSSQERNFLGSAVRAIIRRMAEKHFAPDGDLPILSLSDLPSLGNDVESNATK